MARQEGNELQASGWDPQKLFVIKEGGGGALL